MAVFNKDKMDYGVLQRSDEQGDQYYYSRESMQQLESLQQQQQQHPHLNGVFNQSMYSGQSINPLVQQQSRQQLQPQMGLSRSQPATASIGNSESSLQYLNSASTSISRNHGGVQASSMNGSSSLGMYSSNGIIGNVRNSALEYNSANHQYSGVSRLNQSSNSSQFDNFPLLSSANLSATAGKGSSSLAYNSVASLSANSSQQHSQQHRLLNTGEEEFTIENEDFPALPGSHHISSKSNAVEQQQQQQQQQHGSNGLSLASTGDRHSLQQHQDLLNPSQSSLFSGGGGFGHVHSSSSSIGGSDLSINLSGRGGLLQPQGSALLNSSNLSQDSFSTSSTLTGPPPPPPQPSQQALLHQQQQQPGPPLNKDSKYGLSGLLDIIRYTDKELNVLALGTDLTTFGLNLNAAESLYPSFLSPFSDSSSSQPEPPFSTPSCYLMHPPSLKTEHLSKFQLETLFYMFYSMPKDILQACAAQELYRREWRYHSELRLWLKPRTAQELMQSHPSVHFIYFEVAAWETRLFTTSTGRGNLAAGLLSEDEVRVKAPQPNSAPSMPLGGGPS